MDMVETLYNVFVRAKLWFCLSTFISPAKLPCQTAIRSKIGDVLPAQIEKS